MFGKAAILLKVSFVMRAVFPGALLCVLTIATPVHGNATNVMGRQFRVNELCDDFENINWLDDYNRSHDYWHDTSNTDKRGPELVQRVPTPSGGKIGSAGALAIGRKDDPKQQEMLSPAFGRKWRNLNRSDEPVLLVRLWLPPFDEWGEAYHFGFRHETHANIYGTKDYEYSTSIWVKKDQKTTRFYFRAASGQQGDVPAGPPVEPGWWTLAVAFDEKGVGHYYVSKGTDRPTEDDKVFDTTRFPAPNNPLMVDVAYSYFAIAAGATLSPRFVIDDYEVWIKKPG